MEKLCELQKQVRNYIINELKEYATIIDDNENIKLGQMSVATDKSRF